jgi:hypothetical protein
MADSKISALPASTTPLAGTEVLPIVQSSTTKQVSVANLTAGRAVATGALTVTGDATLSTGDLIISASGKGVKYPVPAGGSALAPAFSAYGNAIQSLSNNTATKVAYNTSVFDTNSNYSTANARFTPTVAGYYQVNCLASCSIVLTTSLQLAIYKNGAVYQNLYTEYNGGAAITGHTDFTMTGSNLVYLNGSTDYIEIYATASNGGGSTAINGYSARPDVNYFNAVMVRAA